MDTKNQTDPERPQAPNAEGAVPLSRPKLPPIQPTTRLIDPCPAILSFTCHAPGAFEAQKLGWVWLYAYYDDAHSLIACSSLGVQDVTVQDATDIAMQTHLGRFYTIPYLGVHTNFQELGGFGTRILLGLIEEVERRGEFPWLVLWVDPENPARGWYKRTDFSFEEFHQEHDNGRDWILMRRRIAVKTSATASP
jgi:ribosomal protein S18 acetylase RimI-like enzyme